VLKGLGRRGLVGTFIIILGIQAVPYGRSHTNTPLHVEPVWDSPKTRGKNYAKGSSLLPSREDLSTKLWGKVASPRQEDPTVLGIMKKHDVTQKKTI